MMQDRKLSNHIFWLLHGVSPCLATLCKCQMNQMPSRSFLTASPLENWRPPERPRTIWMKTTQQDMKLINEPLPERSNLRGSESSTPEIDIYI